MPEQTSITHNLWQNLHITGIDEASVDRLRAQLTLTRKNLCFLSMLTILLTVFG